ncbi:hypothetical protein DPX16_8190 [Anabarilius grahami]|uniref:Uncharacterized protein n=1 Tax=Anabarilius grahami TaxID=495550 RepID=A0A3N0Y8J7_ANAGA|nr:hypothetical protein DPX16_8190 [Anabarilius grahami]
MAHDRRTDQDSTILAEDRLWGLRQNGCLLKRYVEEFLELSYEVSCPETSLCVYFWMGLDKDTIRMDIGTIRIACNIGTIHIARHFGTIRISRHIGTIRIARYFETIRIAWPIGTIRIVRLIVAIRQDQPNLHPPGFGIRTGPTPKHLYN